MAAEDSLPLVLPDGFPEPIYLEDDAQISAIRRADIHMFNTQLKVLYSLFTQVRSVPVALKLSAQIMDMVPRRRDILGVEYGPPANKSTRNPIVFEPVD
jgi:hypothetical protein